MSSSQTCGYAVGLTSIVVGLCLIPLAVARPADLAAPPAPNIVLRPADTPGLKPARAGAAAGLRAAAAALRPARVAPLGGQVQSAHFARRGADLWSLAVVLKSRSRAAALAKAFAAATRRAGLRPTRAGVGEQSWVVVTRRGAAIVVWRRQSAVGEILLTARLRPPQLARTAVRYAAVADARMAGVLGRDAWDRALARIPANGKISKRLALDLFALAYGALPGTTRPVGPAGVIPDGTLAAYSLLANWATLTAEQQAAAARVLGIKGVGAVRRTSGRGAPNCPGGYSDPGDPTFVERPDLEKITCGFVAEYEKHLGPLALTVVVGTSQVGNGLAETLPLDDSGLVADPAHYCRIRLEPAGQKLGPPERNYVLAHEAFHCYQAQILGASNLVNVVTPTRPWLIEGMAVWAGMTVSPLPWESEKDWMKTYVPTVGLALFARAYTAVGFFGHAQEATGDLWARIKSILLAPDNEAAYSAAGGYSPQFVNSWGSSTFAKSKLGPDWTFTSPIAPPSSFVAGSAPLVGDDVLYAGVHAFQRYTLDLAAMRQIDPKRLLIHVVRHRGWARLASKDFDLTNVVDDWFWIGPGEPKCPKGTEGTPPPATRLTSDPSLALTGGANGAVVSVKLVSLDEFCKLKQEPPKQPQGPPAGGGGGGGGGCESCGSSNGDPHLHTFDGVFYDFQGAGEYTLARSRSGDLEVQAREQAYPGSLDVAVNTAIAMRVGGAKVEVDRGKPLPVRLNGLGLAVAAKPRALPGGGRIRLVSGQVEVTWPDGSIARIWSVGSWGVAVLVKPAAARRGTLTGLLGNFDGNPDNDFTTRMGRRLDPTVAPTAFRLLYRVLGEGWRVSPRQSLFTYARGQSTRTFTNRGFPHRLTSARLLSADQRSRALRLCRRLHIANAKVFDSCLVDVGLTLNGAFVTASAQLERTAGGFAKPGKPTRPAKPAKPTKPAKPSRGATSWTRLAGTVAGPISTGATGGKVVLAYRSGQGSAEALTFTPSTARDASGAVRSTITSGWSGIGDPFLFDRPGGGLQVLLTGIHGGNNDPLNGVSFASRNADGSFGLPQPATQSTFAEFVTGTPTLAPDGAPLWAADRGGTLWLWRGATASAGVDVSGTAGGAVDAATVGRDRGGRYWLAWHTAFASQPQRVGLWVVQFDPVTLALVGTPQQAPGSADRGYNRLAFPCAATCRLVYVQPHKLGGARIVSWAPGERTPSTVGDFGVGHGIADPAAAITAGGRLWVAWWDNTGRADFGFRAVRGDARGAGGTPFTLGRPSGSTSSQVFVKASGESLVAITVAEAGQPYVNVAGSR